uniref:Trypsin-co-occurring domain-containing protein n=1 Tax=Nonomuraea gerenzanensis TaxID=93944 RepID=A0A1M4EHK6_9ACTN|nr:hypothetical protein BN4615_P7684 [Nonomuraea gerenzanensis]
MAVPVELADGDVVVFEVDGDLAGPDLDLAAGDGVVARARTSLDIALRSLKPAVSRIVDTVRESAPSEIEIEFGLKISAESTVVVAKGTTEVNFVVRAVWKRS